MKALLTQFDNKRLSNAVATPTCSSCCCCCCCLATSIASSTLLAQRVAKEGKKHQIGNRHMLTILAALFVPIVGVLVYFGFWTINTLLKTCTERTFSYYSGPDRVYTYCTNPGSVFIFPLLAIVPFLVLLYLYKRVHIVKPLKRAVLVTILIALSFVAELAAGAGLILTGIGGIFYLIMIPVVVGWITVWYRRHIGKEAVGEDLTQNVPVSLRPDQVMEQHVEEPAATQEPTATEEPPQQNPPTQSA